MAFFIRSSPRQTYASYSSYREQVRSDFRRRCAYCEVSEGYVGSPGFFCIDHFRPKRHFPALQSEFHNLYWACTDCNGIKGARPRPEDVELFADPCQSDPFVTHLRETESGDLELLTPVGEHTWNTLRLSRETLLDFRRERRKQKSDIDVLTSLIAELTALADSEEQWRCLAQMSEKLESLRAVWYARFSDPGAP